MLHRIDRWIAWLLMAALLTCAFGALAEVVTADPIKTGTWEEETEEDLEETEEDLDEAEAEFDEDEIIRQMEEDMDFGLEPEEEAELEAVLTSSEEEDALKAVNGMTNILLIGLDARPKQKTGRSDTMILMTLDASNRCIKMTSFMRDLYVEIPGHKNNRLNAAYVFGGPDLLLKTLEHNFGVSVDYYVAINFSILADVVDEIGGLTLNIQSDKQRRYINLVIKEDNVVLKHAYPKRGIKTEDSLIKKTGEQLLNGRQVQAYARYRKGSSDYERTTRQREVIIKAMEKIKTMSLTDLTKIALNHLDEVSTNMSIIDMATLAPAAFELQGQEVRQLRVPVDKEFKSRKIAGMAVLVPDRTANRKAIAKFLLS
ncbi:MAG: LCP family protein [Clostridia bacterium]|nr:LCP family protein [Clostridia bacterium]